MQWGLPKLVAVGSPSSGSFKVETSLDNGISSHEIFGFPIFSDTNWLFFLWHSITPFCVSILTVFVSVSLKRMLAIHLVALPQVAETDPSEFQKRA